MSVDYEILLPADDEEDLPPRRRKRHPNTGTVSRQVQKAYRRGILIWNSYERGTYVKRYHEHSLGKIPETVYSSRRSAKAAPIL
jgi:hypothetical protein